MSNDRYGYICKLVLNRYRKLSATTITKFLHIYCFKTRVLVFFLSHL